MKKNIIQTTKIIILGLMLSASFVFAQWSEPTANPTGANISAPINTSPLTQLKSGTLTVGDGLPSNINPQLVVLGDSAFNGNQSMSFIGFGIYNLNVSGKIGVGLGSFLVNSLPSLAESLNIVGGTLKTTSLAHTLALPSPYQSYSSNLREVCSDFVGKMVLCPISTPTPLPAPHGIQTYSPGSTSGTLGTANITTFTVPARVTSFTIETWGGGGGGAGGTGQNTYGGGGGGGGGGGAGYGKTIINLSTPSTGTTKYYISVGSGGAGGGKGGAGVVGGTSKVGLTLGAQDVLYATGGTGGAVGLSSTGNSSAGNPGGLGGNFGSGSINNWNGTKGYPGGAGDGSPNYCNGGAGGLAGVGGNGLGNGGAGGHGGYSHTLVTCTSMSNNADQQPGGSGGNGQVKFSW